MSEGTHLEMQAVTKHTISAVNVPDTYTEDCSKRVRNLEVSLRIVAVVVALVALILLLTDKQMNKYPINQDIVIYKTARYTDMKALVFSVAALGIVAGYSFLQAIRCLVGFCTGGWITSMSWAWSIFLFDQVITYFILSASAAVAQSAYLSEKGNDYLGWSKVCNMFQHFCDQSGGAMIGSFLVTLNMVVTSAVSAYNLFTM